MESFILHDLEPVDYARIAAAFSLVRSAHCGQLDKGGQPYFYHLVRVSAQMLPDVTAAIVGMLHDVLEDCPTANVGELTREFGAVIAMAVYALTHQRWTPYTDYIRALASNPLALKVKIADLYDNLRADRLQAACDNGHNVTLLVRKYVRALAILKGFEELLIPFPQVDERTD